MKLFLRSGTDYVEREATADEFRAERSRVFDTRDDKGMILNPLFWPNHPVQTVKRDDGETGYLLDRGGVPSFRVHFHESSWTDYETVDAMLGDGWRID